MLIGCVISYKNFHNRTFAPLCRAAMGFWRAAETLLHAPCPSLRAHGPGVNRSHGGTKWWACPCRGAFQYRPFGVAIRAVRQCNTGCFATQNGPYCNALSARALVALGGAASCRVLPEGMVNCGRGRQCGIYVATACTCRQPWPVAMAAARSLADGPLEAWA